MCNWGKIHYICLEGCPYDNDQSPYDEIICICDPCDDAKKLAEGEGFVLPEKPVGYPNAHSFTCHPDWPEANLDFGLDVFWDKFCPQCMKDLDEVVDRVTVYNDRMRRELEEEEEMGEEEDNHQQEEEEVKKVGKAKRGRPPKKATHKEADECRHRW